MFSLLSRGYGTYEGTAKSEPNPTTPDHKEYFSLEDFHLPAIDSPIKKTVNRSCGRNLCEVQGPRYENKAFKLPAVSKTPSVPLSKTYSTKRGALLLYAERNALPGSPKARKRRHKYMKHQPVKLKTIGDLRDLVLNYKNGVPGDPLFLALLQKRASASNKERAVRPGFSPKRYIATLGRNSLQDCWDKLASSGTFKDPALQSYNPFAPAVHTDGSGCELFPGKPQPYSTMSLPPVSPSGSMLDSSFHFYKNGMSTGAASLISLNSEEYAPSSRALSPAESIGERLSEVEPLPSRRDAVNPYAMLNAKQKADLLSHLLLQGTLDNMDSDLQRWVTDLTDFSSTDHGSLPAVDVAGRSRPPRHKGGVRLGPLTSVPRLPPIYSAGARLTTPAGSQSEDTSSVEVPYAEDDAGGPGDVGLDVLDPGSVNLHFTSEDLQLRAAQLDNGKAGVESHERVPQAQAAEQISKQGVENGVNLKGRQGDPETDAASTIATATLPTAAAAAAIAAASNPDTAVHDTTTAITSATVSVPAADLTVSARTAGTALTITDAVAPTTFPTSGDSTIADAPAGAEVASTFDRDIQDADAVQSARQQSSADNLSGDSVASLEDVVIDTRELQGVLADDQVQTLEKNDDGSEDYSVKENQNTLIQPEGASHDGKDAASITEREEGDIEDEGIGLEGEETDEERVEISGGLTEQSVIPAEDKRNESRGSGTAAQPTEEAVSNAERKERSTEGSAEDAIPDIGEDTRKESSPTDLPPAISLNELHGQAQAVARKVLTRPQSGMVFMEDVRNAVTMWADRLTNLLGPAPQLQDTRISSAGPQRSPATGQRREPGPPQTRPPVRHRKVSRSAGPSMAVLRNALLIAGGDTSDLETHRRLPPLQLPTKLNKSSRSRGAGGVVPPGHTYIEPTETGSTSSDPTKSIPFDRVSMSDLEMDIFSFVASEEAAMFERLQAEEILEDELAQSNEFKAALSSAVISEAKQNIVQVKATSPPGKLKRKPSEKEIEKSGSPPFHVPRPTEPKPPPGLNNKQAAVKEKGKTLQPGKKGLAKKKGGKAGVKQQKTKPTKSQEKNKVKKDKVAAVKTVEAKEEDVQIVNEDKPEPILRVDSETGETDPEVRVEAAVSAVSSRVQSSKQSPDPSSPSRKQSASPPTGSSSPHTSAIPRLAPRSPEPEVISEAEVMQQEKARKEAEEAAAKQLQRQQRAARRAVERAEAAERRRQEVERKRREREEAKRRAAEEEERLEQLRLEQEEQMQRRGEKRRREREEKEANRQRKEEEEAEKERRARGKLEQQRRLRDVWKQKQEEVMAARKLEDELKREQERIDADLDAVWRREEEERIKAMEEWEREELLEKMRQEEELLRERLRQEKMKEEEERRLQEEQRRKQADALALLRQQQLQRHLFVAGMFKEHHYLALNQRFTRAFTFSYYQLLPWLYLNSLRSPNPLLQNLKKNIQPTIVEEVDEDEGV